MSRKMLRPFLVILLLAMLQGCASLVAETPSERAIYPVQVLYATDRAPQESETGGADYGSKRGRKIHYGIATINVWPIEYEEEDSEGEARQILSQPVDTAFAQAQKLSREQFFQHLQDPAYAGQGERVMLFVHGFKRNFKAAAEHAALIAESIGFSGRMVLWSWPSLDNPAAYLTDRTTLLWSQKHLARFVTELAQRGKIERLVLVAHSLGAQALTHALFEEIGSDQLAAWNIIEQLVLLAPDIDLGIFRRDIVPAINQVGIPTTVYASATDLALITSSSLNGYPRAGDSSEKVYTFPGVDTIDATRVKQSFLGHSYYRRSYAVIDDLRLLIVDKQPIGQRPGLIQKRQKGNIYWKLN